MSATLDPFLSGRQALREDDSRADGDPTEVGRTAAAEPGRLLQLYRTVRDATMALAAPLSEADATVQSMPDASPGKWHLAHTTWFFEAMVLVPHLPGYRPHHPDYHRLFNSYYESLGERHPRPQRGLLTRPSLAEIREYRRVVDARMIDLLARGPASWPDEGALALIELGCHHEQQHQELLLTDILHLFAQNPLRPAYRPETGAGASRSRAAQAQAQAQASESESTPLRFARFDGGIVEIGHAGPGFAFDCEGPRHRVIVEPFVLAECPVSNADWLAFIEDGGYRQPLLWLSEGWARVCAEGWQAPLYWLAEAPSALPSSVAPGPSRQHWRQMSLAGPCELDPAAPVCHISYFEADAFAHWAGARLPTEFEWEYVAGQVSASSGHFADAGRYLPQASKPAHRSAHPPACLPASFPANLPTNLPTNLPAQALQQLFGDVWEWTRSPFAPYPRFRPAHGAVGEYNGKFMCGQFVLRGGSCVTPAGHVRASYRNFFPPDARWQFSGLRLANEA